MKRICIYLGVGMLLVGEATAQLRLPQAPSSTPRSLAHTGRQLEALAQARAVAHSFVAYEHIALRLQREILTTEQASYISALASTVQRPGSLQEVVARLTADLPRGIDLHRGRLLAGLYCYQEGDTTQALDLLSEVSPAGLPRSEREQYQAVYGYLLMTDRELAPAAKAQIRQLLAEASRGTSLWSDRAALYLSSLEWSEGRTQEATSMLEARSWAEELMPEVSRQGALLAYATDTPSAAIGQTQSLLRRYPQWAEDEALVSLLGQAYYAEGDYPSAIRTLVPLLRSGRLSPLGGYALGGAYYHQEAWREAIVPLQIASRSGGDVAPLAQFALGNIYRHEGAWQEAKLAFGAAVAHPAISPALKEQALYQLIEVGFASGNDAFGEHLRQTESFLSSYPRSSYRPRVMELLGGYLSSSADYAGSLALIDRLERSGERLTAQRQEVLMRWASAQTSRDERLLRLTEAIGLGNRSEAYPLALMLRAQTLLEARDYAQALRDIRLARQHSTEPMAAYLEGYAAYNLGKYREAKEPFGLFARSSERQDLRGDALVRLGDIELSTSGRSVEAIKYYQEADRLTPGGSAEALYRISSIYGQRGEYRQQIGIINELEAKYPDSPYLPRLVYDKGRAEMLSGKAAEAERTFVSLQERFPSSEVAPLAGLERALISSNQGQDQKAIEIYKSVVERYPDSKAAQTALADLRSIYLGRDEMDVYASYVSGLSGDLRPKGDDAARLAYVSLESKARRGERVEQELEQYLASYPKSADRAKAEDLLASTYLNSGAVDKAIKLLRQAIEATSSASRECTLRHQLGKLYSQQGEYGSASEELGRAYKLASGSAREQITLGLDLVRVSHAGGLSSQVIATTTTLLGRKDLESEERYELTLLRGLSQERLGERTKAIETYATLSGAVHSPHGAEAIVRRALALFELGKTEAAQQAMLDFASSGTSQQYWLARGFVLLADTYHKQGETYLAQQYIESLRDNYKGTEDDIKEMITTRLRQYAQ